MNILSNTIISCNIMNIQNSNIANIMLLHKFGHCKSSSTSTGPWYGSQATELEAVVFATLCDCQSVKVAKMQRNKAAH